MNGVHPFAGFDAPARVSSRVFTLTLVSALVSPAAAVLAQEARDDVPTTAPEHTESTSHRRRAPEPPIRDLAALTYAARESYPRLRAALSKVVAAEAQLDEATISPFFQWTATAGIAVAPEVRGTPIFSPDGQVPIDNPWRPVVSVGVTGVLPIYTFGKLTAARDAASAGIRAAHGEQELALDRLEHDVRRAYYGLQVALDVQQMISEGRDRLAEAEQQLDEMIEAGDENVSETDHFRLATALAEIDARRSEAQRLERTARHALRTLTGLDSFRVPECPLQPIPFEPAELRTYQAAAGGSRPELSMLQAGMDARTASLDATRARFFPDIGLAATAGVSYGPGITDQLNPFIIDQANYTSLGAGLVARWSLDVWGNYHRVRREEALLGELRSLDEEARRGIDLEVADAYEALMDARRREQAWGRGHREGRRWFVSAASAYQVGAVEARELIDAVKAYFTARFSHLQAIFDVNLGIASLARTTSTDLVTTGGWEVSCEE